MTARAGDGMTCAREPRDRAGLERGAIHDGGVEFVLAVGGEDGALAGVEERIVFEDLDGGLDGVER